MAVNATAGKLLLIKIGTDTLYARTTSLTIATQQVDITSKRDGSWKRYLNGGATKSVSLSVEGVYEDDNAERALQSYALTGTSHTMTIENGLGDKFEGKFIVQNYQTTGNYDGALSYSCSLENDGEIIYTAHQ